jgi:hypothetical protein
MGTVRLNGSPISEQLDDDRCSALDPMNYLRFDTTEVADGILTLEAMASTAAENHAAVMAEVQQVLDWAWGRFPDGHGPVDDGMDWDHDLQVFVEQGDWHTVTLTLTGHPGFVEEFLTAFEGCAD